MPDTVAVLGAGALGAAMAARLAETGHDVRLWNRTAVKARAVAADTAGVTAVDAVGAAVRDADVIITVLRDGDAVAEVMAKAAPSLRPAATWVQASTVGPEGARCLAALGRDHGIAYLDAPVSGSTTPARQGRLVWLVSGEQKALDAARPVLDDLGSQVLHLGTGVEGSSVKLAINAWMTAATVAMSDVLGLCDALGIKHDALMRALQAGPLAMPYALQKAAAMDNRFYQPGFAVQLALKDLTLATEVSTPTPLLNVVLDRLHSAVDAGHGGDDLAAVDYLRQTAWLNKPPTSR
jgi:3-hydroxyisobutyrate dehydrogenase